MNNSFNLTELRRRTAELPLWQHLPQLEDGFARHRRLVIQAHPGTGKSTLVAPLIAHHLPAEQPRVLLLVPRRLAAKSLAARMCELAGCRLGKTIGYRVRNESRVSPATRVEVLTEGILVRLMQADPELAGVGAIIFDEFHERSLHSELSLAFALDLQQALRPDIKLVLMSATMDLAQVAAAFGPDQICDLGGVLHPVEIVYRGSDNRLPSEETVAQAVTETLRSAEEDGDILVFLPGMAEIRRVEAALAKHGTGDFAVYLLHGSLDYREQQNALQRDPAGRRKVILSSPIAETSLTIEGVTTVIDSGLQRSVFYDSGLGFDRYRTEVISIDAAVQRAGRAGRLRPGKCIRLWSEHQQNSMRKTREAEILRADLSSFALELAAWGAADPSQLTFIQQPPPERLAESRRLLVQLRALDEQHRITPHGRRIIDLGLHPRLGHMLLTGLDYGAADLGCRLAALLEGQDLLRGADAGCSIELRLEQLSERGRGAERRRVNRAALADAEKSVRRLQQRLAAISSGSAASSRMAVSAGGLLSTAFPERIAKRRSGDSELTSYTFAGGGGGEIGTADPLSASEYLVAARVERFRRNNFIRLAAAIDKQELREIHRDQIVDETMITWDRAAGVLRAERRERFGEILLAARPEKISDWQQAAEVLIAALQQEGILEKLLAAEKVQILLARIAFVRSLTSESELPELTGEAILRDPAAVLRPALIGRTTRSELEKIELAAVLDGLLNWEQRRRLEALAPAELTLPNGRKRRLSYRTSSGISAETAAGATVVLSATVQELFGWQENPRVGGGSVPVLLEILSPARRPIQTTNDLTGFWARTYGQVRKELRGRYPKHDWPEDPRDFRRKPRNGGR